MTTSALTIFDKSQLPAHLTDLNEQGNIVARDQINQLSFRGKVWRVIVEGQENIVRNSQQDPVASVQVTILDYNKARSRSFYVGGYVEGKTTPPTCWSKDGVAPDPEVREKQSATCALCPKSAKGSKMNEVTGVAGTACAQFKRMVVVPLADPNFSPLLVKIPQTSMWDKENAENEAQGFYAFDQYMDFLKRKGVNHTANITTKIRFDSRTSYPKLVFSAVDWTPATNFEAIKAQLAKKELIDSMLNVIDVAGGAAPEGGAPTPDAYEPPAATAAPAPAAAAAAPAKPAVAVAVAPVAPAATKPRPAPVAAKPAVAPAPAAAAVDPDDKPASFGAAPASPAAPAAPAATPAPAVATTDAPVTGAGLGSLLAGWDD